MLAEVLHEAKAIAALLAEQRRQLADYGPIMAHPAADPVLTRDQAAAYTGRHAKTLERAAKAGELTYLQTGEGGRIAYRLSSLNAWLDILSSTPTTTRRADRERPWGI